MTPAHSRKNAANTRGRPFQKGNPGRPKGARNQATLAAEALLEGEVEALTRKAVELAKEGNLTALRLCLDRILPPRRERPLDMDFPMMTTAENAVTATAAICKAVACGGLTLSEASALAGLVETFRKALELEDLEKRITTLEKREER